MMQRCVCTCMYVCMYVLCVCMRVKKIHVGILDKERVVERFTVLLLEFFARRVAGAMDKPLVEVYSSLYRLVVWDSTNCRIVYQKRLWQSNENMGGNTSTIFREPLRRSAVAPFTSIGRCFCWPGRYRNASG